jgi:hypothetical protein
MSTRPGSALIALALGLVLGLPARARADGVEFYDTLSANEVSLGDTVTLTVQLSGGQQEASNAEVELPQLPEFEVLTQHRSASMRMSFAGGQAQVIRSKVLTLVLQPKRTGTLTIGSAKVVVGGRAYRSAELTLKVLPADPAHRPQAKGQRQPDPDPMQQLFGGNPFQGMPTDGDADPFAQLFGGESGPPKEGDLFLRTTLDKKQAYLGEQVTLSLYLFSRLDVARVDNPKLPKLDAFWAEDIESPANITGEVKNVGGVAYRVYLLKRRALFPLKAGKQPIDPVEVDVVTGMSLFGNGRSVHRVSQALELEVKPLPPGAPASFTATEVGQWRIALGTNPPSTGPIAATVGQPVNLELVVEGSGNLRNLAVPRLPDVRGLRVYDPTPTDKVSVSHGHFGGRRSLAYVVMPERTGTLTIPPLVLPFFNPATGSYESASTQPLTLTVGAGAAGTATATAGTPSASAGQNIIGANLVRPIHTRAAIGEGAAPLWTQAFFVPVLLAPFAFLFGGALIGGVKSRAGRDDPARRTRTAGSRARKTFKGAEALLEQGEAQAYYGAVTRALNDYLSDKTGLSAHGLTRDELRRQLQRAGATSTSADAVAAVLDACDMGRFAPGTAQGQRDVLEQAVAAVESLQGEKLQRNAGAEG